MVVTFVYYPFKGLHVYVICIINMILLLSLRDIFPWFHMKYIIYSHITLRQILTFVYIKLFMIILLNNHSLLLQFCSYLCFLIFINIYLLKLYLDPMCFFVIVFPNSNSGIQHFQ